MTLKIDCKYVLANQMTNIIPDMALLFKAKKRLLYDFQIDLSTNISRIKIVIENEVEASEPK